MQYIIHLTKNAVLKPQTGLKRGRQIVYDSSEEEDNQNKRAKHAGRNYNLFFINNVV
jgi:hypothetical protein